MQADEFKLEPARHGGLTLPCEVQQLLLQIKKARAILFVEDEEARRERSTGEVFKPESPGTSEAHDDLPAAEIAKLAKRGDAFDFLAEPKEDIPRRGFEGALALNHEFFNSKLEV